MSGQNEQTERARPDQIEQARPDRTSEASPNKPDQTEQARPDRTGQASPKKPGQPKVQTEQARTDRTAHISTHHLKPDQTSRDRPDLAKPDQDRPQPAVQISKMGVAVAPPEGGFNKCEKYLSVKKAPLHPFLKL